jgi:hypothetical protein
MTEPKEPPPWQIRDSDDPDWALVDIIKDGEVTHTWRVPRRTMFPDLDREP